MASMSKLWRRRLGWTLVFLVGLTPLGLATHERHTFLIDAAASADEDHDGDYHFKTLQGAFASQTPRVEHNDTVLIQPGCYEGDIVVKTPGVILRATAEPWPTLRGSLTLNAKQVRVEGLIIDASDRPQGLDVRAQDVYIRQVEVFGARGDGFSLDHAPFARLDEAHAHNNGGQGLLATDSEGLTVWRGRFEANGAAGLSGRALRGAWVSESAFSLNGAEGVELEETSSSRFEANELGANGGDGLRARGGEGLTVADSRIQQNARHGIVLEDTARSEVLGNTLAANGGAGAGGDGLLLQGVVGSRVAGNQISGHSDAGAAGIRLVGEASSNTVANNRLTANHAGIALDADPKGGLPQTNEVFDNHLEGSQTSGLRSNGRNNHFARNEIVANNGPGIEVQGAEGELFESNTVADNHLAGLHARQARRIKVVGNLFSGNLNGVVAQDLNQSEFKDNEVRANLQRGIYALRGTSLKLLDNAVTANGEDGVWLDHIEQVTLARNRVVGNQGVGLQLEDVRDAEVHDNAFRGNEGGLAVWGGQGIAVNFNDIEANLSYGLWEMEAQGLDVRQNYWGSARGPSGLLGLPAGDGQPLRGPALESAFPWLPAHVADVVQASLKGWYLPQMPMPQRTHAPGAGISLDLSGLNTQGGWITLYIPSVPPQNAPDLGFYWAVYAGGTLLGKVALIVPLTEALAANADVRLMHWDGQMWQALPGVIDQTASTLRSEVPLELLDGRPLVLGVSDETQQARAWILTGRAPIEGEPLRLSLRAPDRNLDPTVQERVVVQGTNAQDAPLAIALLETAPNSGVFAAEQGVRVKSGTWRLQAPGPLDSGQLMLCVRPRAPFVIDPAAPFGEDADNDFVYQTLTAALTGSPRLLPGERLLLKAGRHQGPWRIETAGVQLQAEPGAILDGGLVVAADGVSVSGLSVVAEAAPAIEVTGSGARLLNVTAKRATGGPALRVTGDKFWLEGGTIDGQELGLSLDANDWTLTNNTIIGGARLRGKAALVLRNRWGGLDTPGVGVQDALQEDALPWQVFPPVDAREGVYVDGAAWRHPSPWELLSQAGQALLAWDLPELWVRVQQLFGQGGDVVPLAPGWSLRVDAVQQGRWAIRRTATNTGWEVAVWLYPAPTRAALTLAGGTSGRAWLKDGDDWVPLEPQGAPEAWRLRLSAGSSLPLLVRLSGP